MTILAAALTVIWLVLSLLLVTPLHRRLWDRWEQLPATKSAEWFRRLLSSGLRWVGLDTLFDPNNGAVRWFWGLLLGTLALFGVQGLVSSHWGSLTTTAAPHGIVSLELAGDPRAAEIILNSWRGMRITGAIAGLIVDFCCIGAYAALLHFLCHWSAFKLSRHSRLAARLGYWLAAGQLLAGACDAGENIALLLLLGKQLYSPSAEVAQLLATLKFGLLLVGLVYILAAFRYHEQTEAFLEVANTVRFSLGISLLVPLVLLQLDQAQDALRVLGEDAGPRFHAVFIFFASALVFAITSWYWARVLVYLLESHPEADRKPGKAVATRLLPRLCGALPLLLGAIALWKASTPLQDPADPSRTESNGLIAPPDAVQVTLLLMAGSMLALMLLGLWLLKKRRAQLPRWQRKLEERLPFLKTKEGLPEMDCSFREGLARLSPITRGVMVATALPGLVLWLLIGFGSPDWMMYARSIGPIAVILLGLGMLVPVGSILVYAQRKFRVPFITLLVGLAVVFAMFDLGDNHAARVLHSTPPPQPTSLRDGFASWLEHRQDRAADGASYPVVFVAAEGGGIRAAYETAVGLAHAQDTLRTSGVDFSHHTFMISSVSGGSVGAAVFAALADRYTPRPADETSLLPPAPPLSWTAAADAVVKQDLLSPPFAAMLSPDLIQRFSPVAFHHPDGTPYFDRSLGLEYALEHAWEDGIREFEGKGSPPPDATVEQTEPNPFRRSIYPDSATWTRRSVPALCINTTRAESGERMVVSSLHLGTPGVAYGQDPVVDQVRPECLADLAPGTDLRLSTAACLSARFPLITSSGYLKVQRVLPPLDHQDRPANALVKQRYVDGGYFENSGLSTLSDVLSVLQAHGPVRNHAGNVMNWHPVIVTISFHGRAPAIQRPVLPQPDLEAGPGRMARPEDGVFPARPRPGSPFDDVLTPVFAFFGTASGHSKAAEARLDYQVQRLNADLKTSQSLHIPIQFYEYETPLPLGWMLSKRARTELRRQIENLNSPGFEQLRSALSPAEAAAKPQNEAQGALGVKL